MYRVIFTIENRPSDFILRTFMENLPDLVHR